MATQENVLVNRAVPLATILDSSISTSTELILEDGVDIIEVNAIDGDVVFKWGDNTPTATDFDEIILEGGVRHYPVPNDIEEINIIERTTGATVAIIQK